MADRAEGDFYPGDLLSAVLRAAADDRTRSRLHAVLATVDTDDHALRREIDEFRRKGAPPGGPVT